jgi:1,4-alpha-glucan branching enzyme
MAKVKPKRTSAAESKQKIKRRKVTFTLETSGAKEVIVAGNFNDWNPKTHPLKADGNGLWKRTMMLPPGTYEYKFVIDGKWQEDPKNIQTCPNRFGTLNSVFNLS